MPKLTERDLEVIQDRYEAIGNISQLSRTVAAMDARALIAECRRLRALVEEAYTEGWNEGGGNAYSPARGSWPQSATKRAL